MTTVWLVVLAGGLGSGVRYLIGLWALNQFGPRLPYGTLIVNLAGCFVFGAFAQLAPSSTWSHEARTAVTAGFLGGFTTYSSFNQETIVMFTNGAAGAAIANVVITLAGGVAAGLIGAAAARMLQS